MTPSRIRFLPALVAAMLVAGCSSPESEWTRAQQDGSEDALLDFVRKYPDSPQAAEARQRIVQMSVAADWQAAEVAGTVEAYEQFLLKHPNSEFAERAEGRRQSLRVRQAWEAVQDSSDAEALRAFAEAWPGTLEAEVASRRAAELAVPAPPPAAAAPAAPAAPARPAAAAGTHRVQLAAFAAEAAARRERDRLGDRLRDALGGVALEVQAGQGMHRVVSGPLGERDARQLCTRLKAAGQECFIRAR